MATQEIIVRPGRSVARKVEQFVEEGIREQIDKKLRSSVRRTIAREVDKTMSEVFRFIAQQTKSTGNFAVLKPYGSNWRDYSRAYKARKQETKGHLRWFFHTGEMARELESLSASKIEGTLGRTQVKIAKNTKKISVNIVPNVRIANTFFENQLQSLLSDETLAKLSPVENRSDVSSVYRNLIGPAFLYFAEKRVPNAIRRGLKEVVK